MAQKKTTLEYTKPKVTIETITPAVAQKWLATQVKNRNVRSKTKVPMFARDMATGRWEMNGESIKFDADGHLIDGQHRLLAVIASGVSVPSVVARGLNGRSQETVDTGTARTAGDAIGLTGRAYRNEIAATAQLVMAYTEGQFKSLGGADRKLRGRYTHSEIVEFIEAHPDVVDVVHTYMENNWRRVRAAPSGVMFAFWACSRKNKAQAVKFFNDIADLNVAGKGDPKAALIRRFQGIKESGERASSVDVADYIFRAWNAEREGRALTKIASQSVFTEPK